MIKNLYYGVIFVSTIYCKYSGGRKMSDFKEKCSNVLVGGATGASVGGSIGAAVGALGGPVTSVVGAKVGGAVGSICGLLFG